MLKKMSGLDNKLEEIKNYYNKKAKEANKYYHRRIVASNNHYEEKLKVREHIKYKYVESPIIINFKLTDEELLIINNDNNNNDIDNNNKDNNNDDKDNNNNDIDIINIYNEKIKEIDQYYMIKIDQAESHYKKALGYIDYYTKNNITNIFYNVITGHYNQILPCSCGYKIKNIKYIEQESNSNCSCIF